MHKRIEKKDKKEREDRERQGLWEREQARKEFKKRIRRAG